MSVLAKGFNFCPTPVDPDPDQYKIDLDSLHRRLCLRARFTYPEEPLDNFNRLANNVMGNKSTFNPVGPPTLGAFILSNEHNFNQHPMFRASREKNLMPGEFKAIKELQDLRDKIVIKPADKVSAVVVQDRETYIPEAHRQLSNPMFYLKVEDDLTPQTQG